MRIINRQVEEELENVPLRHNGRKTLRMGGVYLLPDGSEAVVGVGRTDGRLFLFHTSVWCRETLVLNMPVAYEVDLRGSIMTGRGASTGWVLGDLIDTGSTCRQREAALSPESLRHVACWE